MANDLASKYVLENKIITKMNTLQPDITQMTLAAFRLEYPHMAQAFQAMRTHAEADNGVGVADALAASGVFSPRPVTRGESIPPTTYTLYTQFGAFEITPGGDE